MSETTSNSITYTDSQSIFAYSEISSTPSDYESVEETHENLVKDGGERTREEMERRRTNDVTLEEKATFGNNRDLRSTNDRSRDDEAIQTRSDEYRRIETSRLLVRPGLREVDTFRKTEGSDTSFAERARRSIELARNGHTERPVELPILGCESTGAKIPRVGKSEDSHEKGYNRFSDSVDEHQTCDTQSEVLVNLCVRCSTNNFEKVKGLVTKQLQELKPFAIDEPESVSVSYRRAIPDDRKDILKKQIWSSVILDGQPFLMLGYDGHSKTHMIQLKATSRLDDSHCGSNCWCDKTMAATEEVIMPLPERMKLTSPAHKDDKRTSSYYDRQEWIWAKQTEGLLKKAETLNRKARVCCRVNVNEMFLNKHEDELERRPDRWAELCCRHVRNRNASSDSASTTSSEDIEENDNDNDEAPGDDNVNAKDTDYLSKNLQSGVVFSRFPIVQDDTTNAAIGSDTTDGIDSLCVVHRQRKSCGQTKTKGKLHKSKELYTKARIRRSQRLMQKATELVLLKLKDS